MATTRRAVAVVAILGAIGMMTGCSSASHEVESELWLQVDAAESRIYAVLSELESSVSPAGVVIDRLPDEVRRWDTDEEAPNLPGNEGAAVVYNYHQHADAAQFDVFVTSGSNDRPQAWLDPQPRRVYTCYRLKVAIAERLVSSWHRVDRDKQLACPNELVGVLGVGAQYREPWIFDG